MVEAANSYEYDAVYRLIEATGREHASQGTSQRTHEQLPVGPQPMTSDPSAMRRYTQKYTYDSAGNILTMQHIPASGTGWTRYYQYDEHGNRLEATSAPGDDPQGPYTHTYSYDNHGSMTAMPHLSSMIWNHDDELQEVTVDAAQMSAGVADLESRQQARFKETERKIFMLEAGSLPLLGSPDFPIPLPF